MTPLGSQAFMDPCSPLALTPEGSVNSVSTGPLALTPSPLPARLPVLDQSAELDRTRCVRQAYLVGSECQGLVLCTHNRLRALKQPDSQSPSLARKIVQTVSSFYLQARCELRYVVAW